jgi:hypothetical protein
MITTQVEQSPSEVTEGPHHVGLLRPRVRPDSARNGVPGARRHRVPGAGVCLSFEESLEELAANVAPLGFDRKYRGRELDHMFGGEGFFRGSSVLISGTSGTGKASLAAHFANAA